VRDQLTTRREFLKRGVGAAAFGAAAVAGGVLLHDSTGSRGLPELSAAERRLADYFAGVDLPAGRPRLSIVTGDEARLEAVVRAAVSGLDPALGMRRFVGRGDVVLIKPNAGFDRPPRLGATTHPELLRHVIRLCRAAGARRILIADNPIESPAACFARSGIGPVAAEEGAEIVLPAASRFEWVRVRTAGSGAAGLPDRWPVFYGPLARATRLIGIAPVKDHNLSSASMCLKNWYGLLGGRRNQLHQAIHEAIADLAAVFSPNLVIADGTRVMLRNGPTGGRSTDVQPGGVLGRACVVAAVDPVACDAWCYENLLGRDPAQLRYLALAEERIQAQVAGGARRLGIADWRVYARAGQVVTADV
jgi:uncharacterized protein (DUF362 family)